MADATYPQPPLTPGDRIVAALAVLASVAFVAYALGRLIAGV